MTSTCSHFYVCHYSQQTEPDGTTSLTKHVTNKPQMTLSGQSYQVSYHVRPHLIPVMEQMRPSAKRTQSVKKPIDVFLILSKLDLKIWILCESITSWSRRFQRSMTRSEKKWRLNSRRILFFVSLAEWPQVCVLLLRVNMLSKLVVVFLTHWLSVLSRFRCSHSADVA